MPVLLTLFLLGCHSTGSLDRWPLEEVAVRLAGTEGVAAVTVRLSWERGTDCSPGLADAQLQLDGVPLPFDRSWGRNDVQCPDAAEWRLRSGEFPRGAGDRVLTIRLGESSESVTIPNPTGARHLRPVDEDPWNRAPGSLLTFDSPRGDFRLADRAAATLGPREGALGGKDNQPAVASVSEGQVHVRLPDAAPGEYMLSVRSPGWITVTPCPAASCTALVTAKLIHPITLTE